MNRTEFLTKMLTMYPDTFKTQEQRQEWVSAYERVLSKNLDYDKVFYKMIAFYLSVQVAPSPAWFKQYLSEFKTDETKQKEAQRRKEIRAEGVPLPDDIKKKFKELKTKCEKRTIKMKG